MRFCGVELTQVHPAIRIAAEIPPGMPEREIEGVQGSEGETVAGYTVQRGEYTVRVGIACRTKQEAWRVRALLAAWATASGQGTGELEPTHWPGVAYDAIVQEITPPEFKFGFATVEVVFCLPRPLAHDIAADTAMGDGRVTLGIGGSASCRPVIAQTLKGTRADGLTWTFDGAPLLRVTGSLSAGQIVEVDFGTGSLMVDGQHAEARIDMTQTDFFPGFAPGRHEVASADAGAMRARWRCEWV